MKGLNGYKGYIMPDGLWKQVNAGEDSKEDSQFYYKYLEYQEKERQRIARDLHDDSLQNLAYLIHRIELSSLFIDEDPTKAKLELAAVNQKLKSVIQEIRNIIFNLRPMTFDDLGLKETLILLIERLTYSSQMHIESRIDEIYSENSIVLLSIYRIVEECLQNAIKHSGGSRITLLLENIDNKEYLIQIEDNGHSFDYNNVLSSEDGHFGLSILKERVEFLSGKIEIDCKAGRGTRIKIEIPCI